MKYVRVYADDQGESHFEDVEVPLVLVEFAPPPRPSSSPRSPRRDSPRSSLCLRGGSATGIPSPIASGSSSYRAR